MLCVQSETLLQSLVCPDCMYHLKLAAGVRENGAVKEGTLTCDMCKGVFPVRDFIPVFIKAGNDIRSEGIAVDIDNAITSFMREIDPHDKTSGRLFDKELGNNDSVFLDIGCGIGRHLVILRNNGIRQAFGFDIVFRLAEIARSEYGLGNIVVANARDIPFPEGFADVCLMYNVIEHCSDPEEVLKKTYRVLRKGGRLYMDIPDAKSVGDRIFRWGGKLFYGGTSHIQKFTLKRIEKLVKETGFRIEECRTHRGIFVDYPQLDGVPLLKRALKFLFGNEVGSWELKLIKTS